MKIKKRTLTNIIKWTIRLTGVGVVSGLLYCYFATSFFTIISYQISGIDEVSRRTLDRRLHELDTKKIYKFFPLNKIFTYSGNMITNTVRDVVPEMATVIMRPVGLHSVKIEVTLLKPVFRMSDTEGITSDGIIFSTKYDIRAFPRINIASSTIKTFKSSGIIFTELSLPFGENTQDFFTQVSSLVGKMSDVIFPVESIVVESTGDVSCFDKEGKSKIIFLKDADYKKVWSTLVSAIDTDPLKTKLATNKEGLEYLDVRYGNKVFYRFKGMTFQNGSVTGILGNHATSTQSISTTTQSTH